MFTKEEIVSEYLKGSSKRYSETKNPVIRKFVESQVTLDISHKEKVYCYVYDIVPQCKYCNIIPSFNNFKIGFKDYCTVSCQVKCEKQNQENSRIKNINESVKDLNISQIVHGLFHKTLKIQKWRDIEKLNQYKDFNSIDQLYKHIILKENQICTYCEKVFSVDIKTKQPRKCTCSTKQERSIIDNKNLPKKDFLHFIVSNNLHYYSSSKNKIIKQIYFSKFDKKYDNFMKQIEYDADRLGVPFYGYYSSVSKGENELFEFISSIYGKKIILNDRSLGVELDIYLPEDNIAFEFNGAYWHSSKFKDPKYHLNKTEIAENNNIQLIHIFENEWGNKKDIVKSILKAKLNISGEKIFARKCSIKEVSSKDSNAFLNANHIQGADNAKYRYGLYYNEELVQIITFKRSHRSKDRYMELKRSCSKLEYNIIGGFSKLLKFALNILDEDIVTFADRRYSCKNNVYDKTGFKLVSVIPPNYFYVNNGNLESREKYQKHKLKNILKDFDEKLTEKENMNSHGFYEVYDSGNYKYVYKRNLLCIK